MMPLAPSDDPIKVDAHLFSCEAIDIIVVVKPMISHAKIHPAE